MIAIFEGWELFRSVHTGVKYFVGNDFSVRNIFWMLDTNNKCFPAQKWESENVMNSISLKIDQIYKWIIKINKLSWYILNYTRIKGETFLMLKICLFDWKDVRFKRSKRLHDSDSGRIPFIFNINNSNFNGSSDYQNANFNIYILFY